MNRAAAGSGPGVLIFNPVAGRRRAERLAGPVLEALRAGGFEVEPRPTQRAGHASEIAREAAAGGAAQVFAMGGDGTLREVAAGLLGSATAMGILPVGTTNVVALALGVPLEPLVAARAMAGFVRRPMDVGLANGQPFLMQCTAGFDAVLMARLRGDWKARWGKAAVVAQGLSAWLRYDYPQIEIRVDGERRQSRHVAVCNLAQYAGKFRIAPGARCDDRQLDLRLLSGGRWTTLCSFAALALGVRSPRSEFLRPRRVEILGPPTVPLQVDGDVLHAAFPVVVELAQERVIVLAPSSA
jgi:YegS/Rv2252/BmrU family lipid kinase